MNTSQLNNIVVMFLICLEAFMGIVLIMGSIMLLWLYAPMTIITKYIITAIGVFIGYDIFKTYIHTKWLLWLQRQISK